MCSGLELRFAKVIGQRSLVGALLPKDVPEGHTVRGWLDSWSGVGTSSRSCDDVGYDVRLSRSVFEWSADFCRCDLSQLPPRIGWNQDAKPWKALQRAALETLCQAQKP